MNASLSTCRMSTPLGAMLLVANPQGDALCGLYFERQKHFPPANSDRWRPVPGLPLFRHAIDQVREYFAGGRRRFALPLAPVGTEFQRRVWDVIGGVPFGETITYGELARRCGRPSAVRAAAAATGRNPLTLIIPCHRIVGSGGTLTGYAGGVARKRALLELESQAASGVQRQVA